MKDTNLSPVDKCRIEGEVRPFCTCWQAWRGTSIFSCPGSSLEENNLPGQTVPEVALYGDAPAGFERQAGRIRPHTDLLLPGSRVAKGNPSRNKYKDMAYRWLQGESVPAGTRRIAMEQIVKALSHLEREEGSRDAHIHEARKSMKRLRGLVRLVRFELGDRVYRRENDCFRVAAARLSGLRDATVRLETLDGIIEYCGKRVPRSRFGPIRRWLEEQRESAYRRGGTQADAVAEVRADLLKALDRVAAWPLEGRGWTAVAAGMRRIYARGRREFGRTYRHPVAEEFHNWRKRVKYLGYHAQLLRPCWPPVMAALVGELDRLGEVLGDDHDLAVLLREVKDEFPRARAPSTVAALERRIVPRQQQLQAVARLLGQRIYAERPADFAGRMRAYWRSWEEEDRPPPVPGGQERRGSEKASGSQLVPPRGGR